MEYVATINSQEIAFERVENDGTSEFIFADARYRGRIDAVDEDHLVLNLDGKVFDVIIDRTTEPVTALINGKAFAVSADSARMVALRKRTGATGDKTTAQKTIKAPMPGMVLRINVAVGDTVRKGDGLMVIEAMKMENEIKAPADARVEAILVSAGDAVEKNTVMLQLA